MKKAKKTQDDPSLLEAKELTPAEGPPLPIKNEEEQSDSRIDGGYGWVIVFACMFSNVICLGLQRAYGILFVEFLDMFQLSVGMTSLIMAVQAAFTSVAALLTQTVMLSLLSERQTMIIGSICGGVGLILSYFATSLIPLILTHSVLMGTANGMIMGPAMVIVGKYFLRRRSFAMAVATMGGNLGAMTMPLFTEALLNAFGTQGTLLVLGAFFLNIVVFAGLLRPLHLVTLRRRPLRQSVHLVEEDRLWTNDIEMYGKKNARRWSMSTKPRTHSVHLAKNGRLCISMPELFIDIETLADDNEDSEKSDNDSEHNYELQPLKGEMRTSSTGDDISKLPGDAQAQPPGSSNDLKNRGNNNNDENSSRTKSGDKPRHEHRRKKTGSLCSRVLDMFDFSLFKQPPFLLVTSASSLGVVPAVLYGTYLPAMAVSKGVTDQRAALLLTVFGACGIVSRLGFGYLADLNLIRRAYLMAILTFLSCAGGLFTSLYSSFSLLLIFSVNYGLFGIVFFSLMPVVIVDLMGLENMSKTLGFVQLFQGACMAATHPIIGSLRDLTGDYDASYYFLSGVGIVSGLLLVVFTPFVVRAEPKSDGDPKKTSTLIDNSHPVKICVLGREGRGGRKREKEW